MKTLVATEFADGQPPGDWLWETAGHSVEPGRLKVSGATGFRIPLPGHAWRKLRVEASLEVGDAVVVKWCDDAPLYAHVQIPTGPYGRHFVARHNRRIGERGATGLRDGS